jgi:hypothetical protein
MQFRTFCAHETSTGRAQMAQASSRSRRPMLVPQLLRHREALTPCHPPVIPVPHGSLRSHDGGAATLH